MSDYQESSTHIRSYSVRARDCSSDGLMKLESLFEVLQEEAAAHADARGLGFEDLLPQGRTWLLARMRAELGRRPRYRESIEVETWSRGSSGLIAMRDFLLRGADAQIIVRATSSWLLVDFKTRRPLRPDSLSALLPPRSERALNVDAVKLEDFPNADDKVPPLSQASGSLRNLRVLASDLDVNGHVNNTVYLRLLEDFLIEAHGAPLPAFSSIEVNFLSEAFLGQEIGLSMAQISSEPGGPWLARLKDPQGTEFACFRLIPSAG